MRLQEFLMDGKGKYSAIRLSFLCWMLGVLVMWGWVSFQQKSLQPIPESVITLIGIAVGGKVVQRIGEKENTTTPTETNKQILNG